LERIFLTPGGRARLVARIDATRAAYKAICDDNPAALESGDTSGWHDNFAFEENQRQMHQLARLVRDLEELLFRSTVVQLPRETPERVVLGATVTWEDDADATRTAWIAGYQDGDPAAGRVSYDSPLGRALLGARVGDVRTVEVSGRKREVAIVEIGPTPEGA
jgi:transcription elongation GreA/GreB family factor